MIRQVVGKGFIVTGEIALPTQMKFWKALDMEYPHWQSEYQAALVEFEPTKLAILVKAAEASMFNRLQTLSTSTDGISERQAIADASRALLSIKEKLPKVTGDLYSMVGRRMVTIVVADDFEGFRQLVRSMLLASEFQIVAEAKDGLEAVAKVREFQPDLVLLDINMPKLNGIEAAAQIRSIALKSKVLFVSQNTDPEVIQAAVRDGVMGYVRKSAINCDLLPAIEAALGGERFVSRVDR